MERGRILDRNLFLYLLDLEVKRARRYQNFFYLVALKLTGLSSDENGQRLQACHKTLLHWLKQELRESDILTCWGPNHLVALLPYADLSSGSQALSRLEQNLKFFDFENEGYYVKVDQICFPKDGSSVEDLIRKVTATEKVPPLLKEQPPAKQGTHVPGLRAM